MTWTCPALEIAVSIFAAIHPNVVILDLDYEGADPLTLIATWKEMSPQTFVIVESQTADAEKMREAIERGAQAFLIKPYSLSPLFEMLEKDLPPNTPVASMLRKEAA